MKALKTKVILSAAVLFFALVATIGSTYAWFTVSNTNTVQAMTLNVQTSDSLLIKVYGNQFYYSGTVDASNIVGLDGTTYTFVDGDPDTWTYDGDTFKLAAAGLVDNATGLIVEIPDADIFDTQALANANADLNNAASYFTSLTSAQVAAEYAFSTWRLAPVTAVQTGYATVNGTTSALNVFTTPNTDFLRGLSPIDIGSDVNSATGKVMVFKFWVMSQSAGKSLYLNDLVISLNGTADPVKDQVINAIKLSAKVGSNTAMIYGEDPDYRFAYTSGLPGFYTGSPVVENAFNSIADAAAVLTATGNAVVGNNTYVISALTVDTPTLVSVTVFLEGWDEEATNNVIAADFNISFTFGI